MVTGIECAGLILAILPLFVKVAKAYSDGAESVFNIIIKSKWEKRLEDFYLDFYIQLFFVEEVMQMIREGITAKSQRLQSLPKSPRVIPDWLSDPKFEDSLKDYFRSDERLGIFTLICRKVMMLLSQLVKDNTNRIYQKDQKSREMFFKLQKFAIARDLHTTKSSFTERFAFFRHENKRTECLRKLEDYVKHLKRVTDPIDLISKNEIRTITCNSQKRQHNCQTPISTDLHDLVANLYPILKYHYCRCSCSDSHEVKLCLRETYKIVDLAPSLEIDILFSKDLMGEWKEGNVLITSQSLCSRGNVTELDTLCDAFQTNLRAFSLALLLEVQKGKNLIKRHQHKPGRFKFLEQSPPISMRELLEGPTKLDPIEKRSLALIFAESLLLYYDSDWLGDGWAKENICFFLKDEDEPDLKSPFLSAPLNISESGSCFSEAISYHANSSILALGVLLIEIFNERAIETWKTTRERCNPNPATLQLVADRVVQKMDQSGSTIAIRACLSLDWIPAGHTTSLQDPDIRMGFLQNVILPIKDEIELLKRDKHLLIRDLTSEDAYCDVHTKGLQRVCSYEKALEAFHRWDAHDIWNFYNDQWKFCAPILNMECSSQEFHPTHILPFIQKGTTQKDGHFSTVVEPVIHPSYQIGRGSLKPNIAQTQVALKELKSLSEPNYNVHVSWLNEANALFQIAELRHKHLISQATAFKQGERRFIVLEWADGGILRDIWQKESHERSVLDGGKVMRVLEELTGIAGALSKLHGTNTKTRTAKSMSADLSEKNPVSRSKTIFSQGHGDRLTVPKIRFKGVSSHDEYDSSDTGEEQYWRHGDLKLDNILHFKDEKSPWLGTLKIADLGLAKQHAFATTQRQDPTQQKYTTSHYEAPEVITTMDSRVPRSRRYDIWSVGCIIFEYTTWLLYGYEEGLRSFYDEGKDIDAYRETLYFTADLSTRQAQVSDAARRWISHILENHPECNRATPFRW